MRGDRANLKIIWIKPWPDPCRLTILKEAGLIKERRDGKWSRYRIAEGAAIEMMKLASRHALY